jgi:hypothetical protein
MEESTKTTTKKCVTVIARLCGSITTRG